MIAKMITVIYLISLVSTLWMIHRHPLSFAKELLLNKVLTVFCSGYFLAITFIYAFIFQGSKPLLYFSMLAFCPFVLFMATILKKHGYEGDLNVMILALVLNSMGLVVLYRLDVSSGWFLARMLRYDGNTPMALKQLTYSMVALTAVTLGIAKGVFSRIVSDIEKNKSILVWGFIAFALLATPKLLGFSAMLVQEKSFQPSEFAFKLFFLVFVAKYYESKSSELVRTCYPLKDVLKIVIFVFISITVFFFFPLVFLQKELGTALLIGLSFIILTSYVTGRISFFIVGISLIVLAMLIGVQFSGHVEKRLIGAWLEWQEFAFKPFREGERLYPGYQLFMAIATIKLTPWGVGIGNGILNRVSSDQVIQTIVPKAVHDFVAIPLMSEMGILSIAVIAVAYLILLDKSIKRHKSLSFCSILSVGIAVALTTQGLYNLSCVTALLPTTGIPLPWISYGGSAIFANYILLGLLMTTLNNRVDNNEQ